MNNHQRVYAFGYNAFQQTGTNTRDTIIKSPTCHTHVIKILYASWESTIILNDQGQIDIWGYKPTWFDIFKTMCKDKHIRTVFGDIHHQLLGIIDTNNTVSLVSDSIAYTNWKQYAKDVVYCKELNAFFLLDQAGSVFHCTLQDSKLLLTKVLSLAASESHVLFHCSGHAPVYAIGSNRFSQLGLDFHQELKVDETPTMVEYFCGLMEGTSLSCGSFHSAVVMGGDVYTFGWSKYGRLGWGDQDENSIALAVFLDINEQPVEVNAIKVACGVAHTLVLDDEGNVWSCGSNKYGQLGRPIQGESDAYFRKCTVFNSSEEKAIDCFAGHWHSFVTTA